MPFKPSFEGEVPTLGFLMIDWYKEYLATPGIVDYQPFELYAEQEDFILRWYELDPATGRRTYYRGVLGRPRGWGKSPLLGAIAIGEACGPVLFDGWDANGQPVGKPWKSIRKPLVHIAAVSDDQTDNTWSPMMDMLREEAPIHEDYTAVPYGSYVDLGWGKIEKITSSARSVKGAPTVFASLDQTEEWVPSNGGPALANTIRSNVGKMGGTSIESPNAFTPGEGSVAEGSAKYWQDIEEGNARDPGLLYDHREAPANTDMSDYDSLLWGLRVAYGDSSNHPDGCVIHDPPCKPGHADLERNIRTIWDPEFDISLARSDYLNQIVKAADAWIDHVTVRNCYDEKLVLHDGDTIVLGFDGSKGRNRGNADATALIACRVHDGALFEIRVWEPRKGDKDWRAPVFEVDLMVQQVMTRYRVVGFYADPSGWNEQVARWENKYGKRLRVKASQNFPIAAWPRGKDSRVCEYLKRFKLELKNATVKHDGGPYLVKHLLNARVRKTKVGYLIYKAYPDSPDKIDAAYAATMAYKARTDALALGLDRQQSTSTTGKTGRVVIS